VSDVDCTNDLLGCWTPSFAVIDSDWASKSWPKNIPHDYGFLVVDDVGSHQGPKHVDEALDNAVETLDVSFDAPNLGNAGYALGYPGDRDRSTNPSDLRYCLQVLEERSNYGGYVLDGCGLMAGASGGP